MVLIRRTRSQRSGSDCCSARRAWCRCVRRRSWARAYAAAASSSRDSTPGSRSFSRSYSCGGGGDRRLARVAPAGHYITLATLALGYIAMVVFNEATPSPAAVGLRHVPAVHFAGHPLTGDMPAYILGWLLVVVCGVIVYVIRNSSRDGRCARSPRANGAAPWASKCARASSKRLSSRHVAGLSGALYAYYVGYISPVSVLGRPIDHFIHGRWALGHDARTI